MSAELQELLHSMYIVLQLEACILYSLYYDLKAYCNVGAGGKTMAELLQAHRGWAGSCCESQKLD